MATNDECGGHSIDALIIVQSAVSHFNRRQKYRKYYADFKQTKPYTLKVVFLIGSTTNASLAIELEKENRKFGDTVIGTFLDTYKNLTLKAVMGFRWLNNTCSTIKLLLKMDDDVFFNVRKFFLAYWERLGEDMKKNSLHCLVWRKAVVKRYGKWKIERGLYSDSTNSFPYCAGFFVVITPDLIPLMYRFGKAVSFYWVDDVFLYGLVPDAIKNVQFVQLGTGRNKIVTTSYDDCRAYYGVDGCSVWAVVTDGNAQLQTEFDQMFPVAFNKTTESLR